MAKAILRPTRETRVRSGHPWVFASDIEKVVGEFEPGDVVTVESSKGTFLGKAFYNPNSQISLRMLTYKEEPVDRDFFRRRIQTAYDYRLNFCDINSCRFIYSESDFLPGLIIDKFSDVLVMQSMSLGIEKWKDVIVELLVEIAHPIGIYERNDVDFSRNKFRLRGDTLEIYPAYWSGKAIRVEFFGDEIDRISQINAVTGVPERVLNHVAIYPASHYVASKEKMTRAMRDIEEEMWERVKFFEERDKLLEAQRIRQRTQYDLEMLQEIGFCTGIENYSRVIAGRQPGTPPTTLIDYFPDDFLLFVDESHVTLPQVRAMYNGDHARKESLVDYGFRLPSAYDNRPLKFDEFTSRIHQAIYVSATPADYEKERAGQIAEQVIRPTGLLDPLVEVRPIEGQIDDLIGEINATTAKNERTLVTTLTKKMAEDLTKYLQENGIRVRYMHSDIGAMERMEIIRDLRMAKFDVLVGINLLREGLDLPEVSLIAILDADKEGFLRSENSLIQTIGRAARNAEGRVLLYADKITAAMQAAMEETERRRSIQQAYNEANGITPKTIVKSVRDLIEISAAPTPETRGRSGIKMTKKEIEREIARLETQMRKAAQMMEYEYAAVLRDEIIRLRGDLNTAKT